MQPQDLTNDGCYCVSTSQHLEGASVNVVPPEDVERYVTALWEPS